MYKIVKRTDRGDRYLSFMAETSHGIPYIVGGKTKPIRGWGPLAVFKNLGCACEFLRDVGYRSNFIDRVANIAIFKCRIARSRAKTMWWRTILGLKIEMDTMPQGTVLAREVTLTKEVPIGTIVRMVRKIEGS